MAREEADSTQLTLPKDRSLVWYLACRTAVITLLLGGVAFFYLQGNLDHSAVPLFFLLAIAYAEALIVVLLLRRVRLIGALTHLQIIWDVLFVTILILMTGAVESVFSFAYLLVIIGASFLLSRRLTIIAAATSAVFFGSVLVLQLYQLIHFLQINKAIADAAFFNAVFVHYVAFFLTAILSGTLADRWRRSEAKLQRKSIDYAELERLNRMILAHINSGVMLVNPSGMIRLFNRAASDITGLTLHQVYDRPVSELFPGMTEVLDPQRESVSRAEGTYVTPAGETLILGYATTMTKGNRGENIGTLVTFQDLTGLKLIEAQLKHSDRLAAIGRLSAGLAHEIRNPLASVSGSAQLLLEANSLRQEDQRLLGIVVNEAERLNGLLTDFLQFAKPQIPLKTSFDLSELLHDLRRILLQDQRFNAIVVALSAPRPCIVVLDREQIWQVLWDLSINAAEAMQEMEGHGRLGIGVSCAEQLVICVEDSGPGIADEIKERIFEPFFSTKHKGTGLGLATVFAIIESHQGSIQVDRSKYGGARFTINLPIPDKDQL